MKTDVNKFDKEAVLNDLKKYLPAQAPLKDFIFTNNLVAFQNKSFFTGLYEASAVFGYKTVLSINEFRTLYSQGRIREDIIDAVLTQKVGADLVEKYKNIMLTEEYPAQESPRIGNLRSTWKKRYKLDLDTVVHPTLFRVLCSYLDQGISIWNFPLWKKGFLMSIKDMDGNSYSSFFKTARPKALIKEDNCSIETLLDILVGDPKYYKHYLFDQQFAHQGWSGMVSVIESRPETLIDTKKISLEELIIFELLLEIDFLDSKFGVTWAPLARRIAEEPQDLFAPVYETERFKIKTYWQEAFEWTYYDEALAGIKQNKKQVVENPKPSFQAMFCIDDRETSLRDYIERLDKNCETFGTPGFFNVEFYFQPEKGKFYTKLCPAPITPKYLIKEGGHHIERKKDLHFEKRTFSLSTGWVVTQTLGYWDAIKLAIDIFHPSQGPSMASSFRHMDKEGTLTIENTGSTQVENGLQIGFTVHEMADRVEGLLRSIGLTHNFASLVYVVGHGASSVNNPFFTTMDCGACSCRPGSVNARVFAAMANHEKVRELLYMRGLEIPEDTQFLGGLHDTTVDDILFYDLTQLNNVNKLKHEQNMKVLLQALDNNAKERSRRFESINTKGDSKTIHQKVRVRSYSLFEPRPELDHATNALTIVGRRDITKGLFLDRRAFLNSYNYTTDLDGEYLLKIMKPLGPVCGGINLSYYFSRVDNQKLGAGTKLPHNVMGLFGVANGIDGDLRPGLPSQMVEAHDPIRQMFIIEHFPEVVLKTIKSNKDLYQWFENNWIHLVALHPETKDLYLFKNGNFELYQPILASVPKVDNVETLIENSTSLRNLPVHLILD